ncbi:hypothetical protein [Nocardia sp. NPDC020380]|uniref:hypothetical protein n=1 Tax=Nocardia sp. NPDC020380 TaxID=3364309 RepID=UPI00379AA75E
MVSSQQGRRAGRTATEVVLALGVVGTIGASAMAYTDTHVAPAPTPATDTGSSDSPGSDGIPGGTVPQLGTGSGPSHARSSGS